MNVASSGCEISFCSFDAWGRRWGLNIIIFTPISGSIWVFLDASESYGLYLSGPFFSVQMWPVLVVQFHFEVFMLEAGGDVGEYHYFYSHFLLNFGVLGYI